MNFIISLGDLVKTNPEKTFNAFISNGFVQQENIKNILPSLTPIIDDYKKGALASNNFALQMVSAINSQEPLVTINSDSLKDCWNAMVEVDHERAENLRKFLRDPEHTLYLVSYTNPWHLEALGGMDFISSLGIAPDNIFFSCHMAGDDPMDPLDPMDAALLKCTTDCGDITKPLIYLTKGVFKPSTLSSDKERYEANKKKLETAGFVTCNWPEGQGLEDAIKVLGKTASTRREASVTAGAGAASALAFAQLPEEKSHPLGDGFEWEEDHPTISTP